MSRVVVLAVVLAFMPPACDKLLGNKPPAEPELPAPAPAPITSATTPPIWRAPDMVAPAASSATTAAAVPASPELVKARTASEAREFKRVRALLERKVRAGRGVSEEIRLLFKACIALKDKACVESVKAKHPEDAVE